MTNPSTYYRSKLIYIVILVSFQSAFLQNVCHGHFHWIKNYTPETQQLMAMLRSDKQPTSHQKSIEVSEDLLSLYQFHIVRVDNYSQLI